MSKLTKNLNKPCKRNDYFKTISLGHSKDIFMIDSINDNANKRGKVNDNQFSTLSSQSNCVKFSPYEESDYITMSTDFVLPKLLKKKSDISEKKDSVQFTVYTV
ncbi:Hypothetical protein SRAE_X000129900 [Strongyloides ratti]|uniref:Uncharacterized protein n=1 Tax=Strongyloides ratti TaxID=34506 RepID=A0A090KWA5_STRRB|nr:Hypothetical protein SRAE_X000129900 [Strongyloides ratti]CEF59552.1 Hypothetical protein SRAE_X000129900 [Strongyloides ratti]